MADLEHSAQEEYDSRFTKKDKKALSALGISPEKANQYKFLPGTSKDEFLVELAKKEVTPEKFADFVLSIAYEQDSNGFFREKKAKVKFSNEYTKEEKKRLRSAGISPEEANDYVGKFNCDMIIKICLAVREKAAEKSLKAMSLEEKIQKEFDERFKIDRHDLKKTGISPELALQYDRRFGGIEIAELFKAKINPEEANRYDARFGSHSICILTQARIQPEQANKYDKRFQGEKVTELIKLRVSPEEAVKYDEIFSGEDVVELARAKFSPEEAVKYDARFASGYGIRFKHEEGGIIELAKAKIPPEKANKYNEKFSGRDIADLFEAKISPEEADRYDARFTRRGVVELARAKVSPEQATKYVKVLRGRNLGTDIAYLAERGITPEQASQFNKRFESAEICYLVAQGVAPEEADKYNPRFNGLRIADLKRIGCSPEQADSYLERFNPSDVYYLAKANIPPEKANKFDKKFNGETIAKLVALGADPEKVNSYNKRYDSSVVIELVEKGITQEQMDGLYAQIGGDELMSRFDKFARLEYIPKALELFRLGFTPDMIKSQKINKELLEQIISTTNLLTMHTSHKLIGTGASGIVFSRGKKAYKFSKDIMGECELLRRIQDANDGKQENIVKILGERKNDIRDLSIQVEYIQGDSLENILKQKGKLDSIQVMKYGAGIANGLIEMRRAGIWYHRDIRPANIMIDEEKDRAVIVDLGIATTLRHALSQDNRRFGSVKGKLANDLVSLGQIMYYMTTGAHIFDESQSMRKTYSSIAEEIADYRTKVYADPTGKLLQQHLRQVDETVEDKDVATLIKSCLTARRGQYKRMYRMFKQAMQSPSNP